MTYDTEFVLWNPIARKTDKDGVLPELSDELTNLRYLDGTLVVKDELLTGAPLMRDILLELGKMDDVAFRELGYKNWAEANQKSLANNPYIYKGIINAIRKYDRSVKRFEF